MAETIESIGQAARWIRFVREVERGYRLLIDNYKDDLGVRDTIEEVLLVLDDRDRGWLRGLIEPADAAFVAATRPDSERLVDRNDRHRGTWWWHRVPNKLGSLAGEHGIYRRGDPRRVW